MKPYRLHHNINTDQAWERLHNRLLKEEQLEPRRIGRRAAPHRFIPYAAAIVIIAGIAVWVLLSDGITTSDSQAEQHLHNEQGAATLVATLEDGSIVYLGENSRLSYPEHFAAGERKVFLDGNAMFSVEANPERPFRISTKTMMIEVTGTSFDVESNSNSLSVQHGRVKVTLAGGARSILVGAGQSARISDGELSVSQTSDDRRLARYMQFIRFKDETLGNIVRVINSRGGEASIIASPALENEQITVTFAGNDSAENIARLICNAFEWQLSQPAPHQLIIAPAEP